MEKVQYRIEEHADPEILKMVLDKIILETSKVPSPSKLLQKNHWLSIFTNDLSEAVNTHIEEGNLLSSESVSSHANFYLGEVLGNLSKIMGSGTYRPVESIPNPEAKGVGESLGIPVKRIRELVDQMNSFISANNNNIKYSQGIVKCSQIAKDNKEYGFLVYAYTQAQAGGRPLIFGLRLR